MFNQAVTVRHQVFKSAEKRIEIEKAISWNCLTDVHDVSILHINVFNMGDSDIGRQRVKELIDQFGRVICCAQVANEIYRIQIDLDPP